MQFLLRTIVSLSTLFALYSPVQGSTLPAPVLAARAAIIARQSWPDATPPCAYRCWARKVTEADTLAPGVDPSRTDLLCQSTTFVQAWNNCLTDHCSATDLAAAQGDGTKICQAADASVSATPPPPGPTGDAYTSIFNSVSASASSVLAGLLPVGSLTTTAPGATTTGTATGTASGTGGAGGSGGSTVTGTGGAGGSGTATGTGVPPAATTTRSGAGKMQVAWTGAALVAVGMVFTAL